MSVADVFRKVRAALEASGIPYFVSGSFASSAHGVPRSTNDIDIVIAPTAAQLRLLLENFPVADYAKDEEDAFDALERKSQFQVIDYATMWKVDFMIDQGTPFDASRFARRQVVDIAGVRLQTASPEDVLITKLWWAKLSDSDRQLNDAAGILRVQAQQLDESYVEKWVTALDLRTQWLAVKTRAL